MLFYIFGIAMIVAGGVFALVVSDTSKAKIVSAFTGIGSFFAVYPAIKVLLNREPLIFHIRLSAPFGDISLILDMLSAFFVIVIAIMSFLGILYAVGYMLPYCNKGKALSSHFLFLSILIASMLLTVTIHHALAFLIVWEIMSLSSFFLVTFEHEKNEVYDAGLNYLIAMHIGAIFLTAGFIVLSLSSGSFDFMAFKTALKQGNISVFGVFILFFIGFGMKAGFVPLHTWLPQAHPAAPSHISGIMSGIMIKTGIYGILRIITLIDSPSPKIGYFVLSISVLSGLLGVAYAIAQHNLKKLLAYHSVENIGIIGIGIGIGMLGISYHNSAMAILGFSGAILHVLNHSIFKSLLFYAAGIVYQKTHTVDIERLGGLAKRTTFTTAMFLIGSLAISGLPPLNGFISEFFIYWGMFNGLKHGIILSVMLVLSISGLACIGAMAMLCFTKAFGVVFLGSPRSCLPEDLFRIGLFIKIPMLIECVMIALIGLFPAQVFSVIYRIASQFADTQNYPIARSLTILNTLSKGFAIFLMIAASIWLIRYLLLRSRSVYPYKTWDCGYQAGNVRMQYTASSYAAPFINIIKPVLDYHEQVKHPARYSISFTEPFAGRVRPAPDYREMAKLRAADVFPITASFESHTEDRVESNLIDPMIRLLKRFLKLFSWIQSGNIQMYILYGLIFLVAVTIWIMGS